MINLHILVVVVIEEGVAEALIEEGYGKQDDSEENKDNNPADSDHFPNIVGRKFDNHYAKHAESH